MSDSTISQLPAASPLTGGELFPVDQGGVTKKATLSMIGYGSGSIVIAGGKIFTVNAALTLNGTDGTSILFPTTNSVMARTDAPQTFTGLQTFTDGITGSQITSTIATGTAPFVVASTTPVANLSIGGTAANATTAVTLTGLTATIANLNTVTGALGTAAFTATTDYAPAFVSGTQNYFWATPNGSSGVPSLRAIVAADIPTLNQATTANAGTATKLAASVTIDGVSFDGSANITVIAPATHAATNKATPVAADEFPLYDSVSGLLNKVTFTNLAATIGGGTFAPIAGNASQVFSVAPAVAAANAVRLDQMPKFPFRNRIVNGDMSISQVYGGTAVTILSGLVFSPDQWASYSSVTSKFSSQQVADAPAGFKYSTKLTVLSQYAAGASEPFVFLQNIEGQNLVDFQMGTAGAAPFVVSFWIKGSVAGTYSVSMHNGGQTRSYIGTVSVTSAWQRLSISVVGDTTGTWLTDNSSGFLLEFDLGSGSNFNTTAGTWQTGNYVRTAGSVAFINQVNGSTLNITGVQVETQPVDATTPTAYEVLPYEAQLRRCRRYLPYFSYAGGSWIAAGQAYTSQNALFQFPLSVPTRAQVTGVVISALANFGISNSGMVTTALSSITTTTNSLDVASVVAIVASTPLTPGNASTLLCSSNGSIYFTGAQL